MQVTMRIAFFLFLLFLPVMVSAVAIDSMLITLMREDVLTVLGERPELEV